MVWCEKVLRFNMEFTFRYWEANCFDEWSDEIVSVIKLSSSYPFLTGSTKLKYNKETKSFLNKSFHRKRNTKK